MFYTVDCVINAINKCKEMDIKSCSDHDKHHSISDGFRHESHNTYISCCAGCIDGILIWTHSQQMKTALRWVWASPSVCCCKHKFGLNLQTFCNQKKQFIGISTIYNAMTSNHLAFKVSGLRQSKLGCHGFLAPGRVLFGNNAYVNTFLWSPYPNASKYRVQDNYNFYHV